MSITEINKKRKLHTHVSCCSLLLLPLLPCHRMESKEGIFRRQLVDVHGVALFWSIAEAWSQVENFQAKKDDLLIATYPKSGACA